MDFCLFRGHGNAANERFLCNPRQSSSSPEAYCNPIVAFVSLSFGAAIEVREMGMAQNTKLT